MHDGRMPPRNRPQLVRPSPAEVAIVREWIAAGEPDEDTMAREAPVERVFGLLEGALRPLPVGMRNMVEIGAGVLWRGATER